MGSGTVSTQREHTYIAIDLKSFYASVGAWRADSTR